MHAHTHLSHKYTYTDLYMYNAYIYTNTYIHSYIPSFVRAAIPTHVGTRKCACPHVCAPTRVRASAVPPRTTGRAASNARRSRPAAGVRRPGPEKGGAYIGQRGDGRGVPRADVRVERRRMLERLRAEPPAVHADGTRSHVSARMRRSPIPHAHTRARARAPDAARARVCAAHPHRRFVRRCSQPRMDMDTCMHHVYIHCVCACPSMDGVTKTARRTRTRAAH
jgi:hypothetical protein